MTAHTEVPTLMHDTNGSGAPLILMPGGLTGWLSWIPHAKALAASRRVIRLQLLSVELGLSGDALPPNYSVNYEVAALGKTLDALAIQQADFACWSYGAAITLSYAIHNPDRVRSLTLIEPPALWVLRSRGLFTQELRDNQAFARTLATDGVSEEELVEFTHFAGLVPKDMDPRTLPQWPVWLEHRQSLRMGDAPYRHDDSIELVSRFEKAVLLVKGEGSSSFYHDLIDILAEELPHAEVVTFPGAHAAHIISMEPFMERFARFLLEQT